MKYDLKSYLCVRGLASTANNVRATRRYSPLDGNGGRTYRQRI